MNDLRLIYSTKSLKDKTYYLFFSPTGKALYSTSCSDDDGDEYEEVSSYLGATPIGMWIANSIEQWEQKEGSSKRENHRTVRSITILTIKEDGTGSLVEDEATHSPFHWMYNSETNNLHLSIFLGECNNDEMDVKLAWKSASKFVWIERYYDKDDGIHYCSRYTFTRSE